MYLKPRLRAVANMIPDCECFADIGTDHAYIPIAMLKEKTAKIAIASDIGIGPLKHAQENIKKENLENKIFIRIGAGLASIKMNEINGAVIAGMGGKMIRKILENDKEKAEATEWFVLQPMKNAPELRRWLVNNGYIICEESLAKEDWHIYEILFVKHGEMKIEDEFYYETGVTENIKIHLMKNKREKENLRKLNLIEWRKCYESQSKRHNKHNESFSTEKICRIMGQSRTANRKSRQRNRNRVNSIGCNIGCSKKSCREKSWNDYYTSSASL